MLLFNRISPNNRVNYHYRCLDFDYSKPAEVEQPAAACLLVRREAFENCGGFDERFYPLWFEDVDLCLRLRKNGGKIVYTPEASFRHAGGHSVESITFAERQVYWYRNLLYYVQKHYSWAMGITIRGVLLLGVAMRLLADLVGLATPAGASARSERVRGYMSAAKLAFQSRR
jgi:GT2 family glycosyltransferase